MKQNVFNEFKITIRLNAPKFIYVMSPNKKEMVSKFGRKIFDFEHNKRKKRVFTKNSDNNRQTRSRLAAWKSDVLCDKDLVLSGVPDGSKN